MLKINQFPDVGKMLDYQKKNELDKIANEKGLTRTALIVTIINEFLKI